MLSPAPEVGMYLSQDGLCICVDFVIPNCFTGAVHRVIVLLLSDKCIAATTLDSVINPCITMGYIQ